MHSFWKVACEGTEFNLYSKSHLFALIIILEIIIFLYINKANLKNPEARKKIGWVIGMILFLQQFFLYFWYIDSGNFTLKEGLPLYICRIVAILCIFMMLSYNYKSTLKSLRKVIKWLLIYTVAVGMFNYVVGENYSYLREKPLTSTLLDYLPLYPYYIPIVIMAFVLIFMALYLPFYIQEKKENTIMIKNLGKN